VLAMPVVGLVIAAFGFAGVAIFLWSRPLPSTEQVDVTE